MRLEHVGIVGNCQFAALIDRTGTVVWSCLPRFDAEPVFGALLDEREGGRFTIAPPGAAAGTTLGSQRYLSNTNVLETTFTTPEGKFRVIDFAPRFLEHGTGFRPTQLMRIIEPLEGTPRVQVVCQPRIGWGKGVPAEVVGSHHIRYEGFATPVHLHTDVPLSYLDGRSFTLTERKYLVFSWGQPPAGPLAPVCENYLRETVAYWRRWVKHCNIPSAYQPEVIRSALALKLHCYEDTGAIVAAMTTSIPEAPGSGRTWDYRYCWLRDAFYVLGALRLLGHFEERENFVNYLLNVAGESPTLDLAPLYRVDGRADLEEKVLTHWPGFAGEQPVRVGNAAALHAQHDIYGEMVLALAPIFLDDRFSEERSPAALALVERLARKAISLVGVPDAGIWEYRTQWKPQTFSSLMCWAAADRMARVATRFAPQKVAEFTSAAQRIREEVLARAWNPTRGSFVASYDSADLDASLLQMVPLRFLPPDDERIRSTVQAISSDLGHAGWLYRYKLDDGFGHPSVAFIICNFWLVEALATCGRGDEAKSVLNQACAALSPLGLLSEDYDTATLRMWGNFPQAYSHVGLIHAAFAASPRWSEML
jgi:GH15 family glucan-1,4-alpha-glucosidase